MKLISLLSIIFFSAAVVFAAEAGDFDLLKASTTVAVSLTSAKVSQINAQTEPPCSAFITIEDAAIRFRVDGTSPTASTGHKLNPGDSIVVTSLHDIRAFVAIATVNTTTGTLNVSYFRGCR